MCAKCVYRNGDVLTPPIKILLYRHTLQSYDAVLNDITEKVQLLNGAVLKLYTMDGEQIQHPSQLQSGQCYVAANKEKLKRVEYFPPEEFGMSPRALRKADFDSINPINTTRTHDKVQHRKMWLPFASQPASNAGSTVTSGKSTYSYQGKPYLGWHPNRDELVAVKGGQRLQKRQNVKIIDVDKDDSGIYKAKKSINKNNQVVDAHEIPDDENMIVDLPVNMRQADEIDNEELYLTNQTKPKNKQSVPKFEQYQQPTNQNNSTKKQSFDDNIDTSRTIPSELNSYDLNSKQQKSSFQNDDQYYNTPSPKKDTQKQSLVTPTPKKDSNESVPNQYYNTPSPKKDTQKQSLVTPTPKKDSNESVPQSRQTHNSELNQSLLEKDDNLNELNEAATKIQAAYRGYSARKTHDSLKQKQSNNNSSENGLRSDSKTQNEGTYLDSDVPNEGGEKVGDTSKDVLDVVINTKTEELNRDNDLISFISNTPHVSSSPNLIGTNEHTKEKHEWND